MRTFSPPSMRCMRLFHGALLTVLQGTAVKGELQHVQASSNHSFPDHLFPCLCAADGSNLLLTKLPRPRTFL